VIEVARSLQMDVVAEGVEDQATWTALQHMGCFAAQGYLVTKPLPVADLERWLSDWPDKSARLNAA
jgi:EAL domain-containing protein (putative c-di-GMP-specific phosphodiesterase class I)